MSDSVIPTPLKARKLTSRKVWCRVVSSLRYHQGQTLTLAVLLQRPIASHSLVKAFVQGVTWIGLSIFNHCTLTWPCLVCRLLLVKI